VAIVLGLLLARSAGDWLWVLLVGAGAALIGTLLLTRIAARSEAQVRQIQEAIARFGEGDLEARPPLSTGGNLRSLADEFSRTADRLSQVLRSSTLERSQMAALFEQMHDGIILTDESGRIGSINLAAARLFNTTREDAIGRSLIEVTRDYELHNALRTTLSRPNERQSIEVRSGPRQVSLRVSAVPDPAGGPPSGLVVLQDITEVRQLERVRRDFVANIGHEFRTPLASIKLIAETLHTAIQDDPERAREFLRRIDMEVDGLTDLVRELLELSRIESGQIRLVREQANIARLIDHAAGRLRPHAERAGLYLTVHNEDELPTVWADPTRIEAVIVNLLHNAIKFTPPGGHVTVTSKREGAEIIVSVADTGQGVLPEDLPRVFERFYKGDTSRTRQGEQKEGEGGTGLGLAIAKHTIQAHGGRIWAESHYGNGATFHFTLPIQG
jgi:two-component system, OmpR family, phosphate regulon sensor histidine kinase PhoR